MMGSHAHFGEGKSRPAGEGGLVASFPNRVQLRPNVPVLKNLAPLEFGADQYRSLAIQIDESRPEGGTTGYTLAVTSAEAGAGKTLTAFNLAIALSETLATRVLLVEGDLWRPRFSEYVIDESDALGLFQVLSGQAELDRALRTVDGVSVDLLPAGTSDQPGEVLGGRRLLDLLGRLRERYEMIVLDAAPMGVASGRVLTSRADSVVVVVRAGQSRRRGIERVLSDLGPDKVAGIVFNDVRTKLDPDGYYGYRAY